VGGSAKKDPQGPRVAGSWRTAAPPSPTEAVPSTDTARDVEAASQAAVQPADPEEIELPELPFAAGAQGVDAAAGGAEGIPEAPALPALGVAGGSEGGSSQQRPDSRSSGQPEQPSQGQSRGSHHGYPPMKGGPGGLGVGADSTPAAASVADSTEVRTWSDEVSDVPEDVPRKPPPLDVELTLATQALLLTWARWGRNSLRIKKEEQLKALQHVKYPRSSRAGIVRTPVASPQPTPRDGPSPSNRAATDQNLQPRPSARLRPGTTSCPGETVASRGRSGNTPNERWMDTMLQDQRESMAEQGTKLKLGSSLGAVAAQGNSESTGTPGFGVDTPNFVGVKSRSSQEASIASSGIASPLAGGQMSPWILEAEALLNGDDGPVTTGEQQASGSQAWGISPALLEQIPELSISQAAVDSDSGSLSQFLRAPSEDNGMIVDEDELEKVSVFVNSPMKPEKEKAGSPASTVATAGEPGEETPTEGAEGERSAAAPVEGSSAAPAVGSNAAESTSAQQYAVGEVVSYWSGTHNEWMLARVVERRSRSVYLIDKQMRGCFSKVRASDLVSESEVRREPVLRAVAALEEMCDKSVEEEVKVVLPSRVVSPRTPSSRSGGVVVASKSPSHARSASAASPAVSRARSPSSATPALPSPGTSPSRPRGRIVRDDFSDDSDD